MNAAAQHYPRLTFDRVLTERLNVMDATAIVMCRDHRLPLRVFNLNSGGDCCAHCARRGDVGTLVTTSEGACHQHARGPWLEDLRKDASARMQKCGSFQADLESAPGARIRAWWST